MIKVMLVDDQTLLLDLMEQMLKDSSEITVVARASDGKEALELAAESRPDLVLMDLDMPVMGGAEATRLIKEKYPQMKVLILTVSTETEDLSTAMGAGADGYILKRSSKEDLLLSITGVYRNMEIIQGEMREKMRQSGSSAVETAGGGRRILVNDIPVDLTARELEIINLIVQGKSSAEMADILYLSQGRIRNIITEILAKLQVKDRAQLAVYALKNKLA